jgi:hypothetical protein
MFIDLGEEIPYDPEDEDNKSSSKKKRSIGVGAAELKEIDE